MIQGFSSGLIGNRELIYETDLPSFQRDFASLKTLDHGTGPNITFTRASDATYFDANGTLQTASNNEPRFDHDPATGASRGLLIEEARTNSIRNSQAGGAVAGAPGTMPTFWSKSADVNGLTSEVVGAGSEAGLAYVDIKISGTPTANATFFINIEGSTQVVAANGQIWTHSLYVKLASGSTNNATTRINISGRTSGGSGISGQDANSTFVVTSAALNTQRASVTQTFSDATVARVFPFASIAYTSGNPIDITLRIAAPQLEQGAFPTSYIPTTTAAATRSADSAVVTPISGFYNQAEGTFVTQVSYAGSGSAVGAPNRVALQVDNNNVNDRHLIQNRAGGTGQGGGNTIVGGAEQSPLNFGSTTVPQDTPVLFAYAYRIGTLSSQDTSALMPTVSRLRIGAGFDGVNQAAYHNGHIRKIAYWPKRLTNTLLQQLTT
jgi:hypothetical protein